MKTDPVSVMPDISVKELVDEYIYKYHYKMYPVVHDGQPMSCVTTKDIKELPREQWEQKKVFEVAHPCNKDNSISTEEDAVKALSIMNKTGNSRLIVIDKTGHLRGMIALKDLLKFLSIKIDLDENEFAKKDE
jgi:predicted transcriptional regulator